jgi:hypothetical protein
VGRQAQGPVRLVTAAILVAIVVGGAALELRNLREWLPTSTHVDEPCFAAPAAHLASDGTLNPGWFGHPGSTLIYPVAALYAIGWGRGARAALEAGDAGLYVVARSLSIAYAALGLVFVFLLGRRLTGGDRGGLVAAAMVAVSPPIVELCATARSDGASLLFGALALHALFRAIERPSLRSLALAGVALGAAIATKYYFAVFGALVPVAVAGAAHRRLARGERIAPALGHAVVAGLAAIATFALLTPYFFLDWKTAMRDLRLEAAAHAVGTQPSWSTTFRWYLTIGLPELVGGSLVVVALVIAIVVAAARRRARPLVLVAAALGLLFIAATSALHLTWTRWLVPVAPLVGALLGSLVVDTADGIARRARRERVAGPLAVAATIALVFPSLRAVVGQELPRAPTLARRWIADEAPAGALVAMDGDGGEWLGLPIAAPVRTLARGVRVRRAVGYLADAGLTLDALRCEGVDYLVLDGLHAMNVMNGWEAATPLARELYRRVATDGRPVTTFASAGSPERRVVAIGHLPCPTRGAVDGR